MTKPQDCDIAIIGGGIIGAGIARDAALRGLSVVLIEKEDFAAGTSSRATRLIHGGLRYLETLDFGLVRQDLREREILLAIAPHLIKPLAFLMPFYGRNPLYLARIRAGMALYDALSYDKSLPRHRMLSPAEALAREPSLRADGLQGAALYWDAQVSLAERLTLENALDARDQGAVLRNHTRATGLLRERAGSGHERAAGVRWTNVLTGETGTVKTRLIVNASGPWLDSVEHLLTEQPSHRLRRTKGVHFAAPPLRGNHDALVLFAEDDRLFFVVPWLGYAWVGTTDTDFDSDLDTVHADASDVDYLIRGVQPLIPGMVRDTIYFTNAGVRALGRHEGIAESDVSRKHELLDHAAGSNPLEGLVSVVGGKITAYRAIAEEVVDLAVRKLGVALTTPPCRTAEMPLPGARGLYPPHLPLSDTAIAEMTLREQVERAVAQEECRTLCDFMKRRSLLYFTPDQGRAALPIVVDALAAALDWDSERRAAEIEAYEDDLALTQAFRVF